MKANVTRILSLLLTVASLVGNPVLRAQQTNDTILIDFGTTLSDAPYNNLAAPRDGAISRLQNARGLATAYGVTVTDPFNAINLNGETDPDGDLGFPGTATGDSFYGNSVEFNNATEPTGALTFSALKPEVEYTFTITASRGGVSDNRSTMYVAQGMANDTAVLDAANNASNAVTISARPRADSTVVLSVSAAAANDNANKFYYLGALTVSYPFEDIAPPPPPPSGPDLLDTVLVDFGGSSVSPGPWNNLTDDNGGMLEDLINSSGFNSGLSIMVVDEFNGINTNGTFNPDPALGFTATATGDSFFGNGNEWNGVTEPTGAVELTGLDPEKDYTLEIFASRVGDNVTDDRETRYEIDGATAQVGDLKVSNNTDAVATFQVRSASDGSIRITASPGPNNDNQEQFFYLGLLRLTYENTAPVGEASLSLVRPNDGEYWQVGSDQLITWQSTNVGQLVLEYTTSGGDPWTLIDTVQAYDQSYNWTVPNNPTNEARVRLRNDDISDASDRTFIITTDSTNCTIVVLGSSTAEGQGANPRDSAWVNLYRSSLAGDSRFDVVNLGRGGYNTYHVLPTGSDIPSDVSTTVDTIRNITRALSLDPYAIIINLPSNDAAANVPIEDQLANMRTITDAARDAGVMVYVATTQPRNFDGDDKVAYQIAVRDSIYAIYGDNAIDFWSGFADEEGRLVDSLDSGDGVHVNNAGHRILFERVAALRLDTMSCDTTTTAVRNVISPLTGVSVYPNPSTEGVVYVEFDRQLTGEAEIRLVDLLGRERYRRSLSLQDGTRRLTVPTANQSGARAGEYLVCTVMVRDGDGWRRKTFGILVR